MKLATILLLAVLLGSTQAYYAALFDRGNDARVVHPLVYNPHVITATLFFKIYTSSSVCVCLFVLSPAASRWYQFSVCICMHDSQLWGMNVRCALFMIVATIPLQEQTVSIVHVFP